MTLAVFAAVLDAATLGAFAAWWRHRHKTPVPEAAPPGLPVDPVRAAPAPGLTPDEKVACDIRIWACGRIRTWNGSGDLISERKCKCPVHNDWDTALREELMP